MKDFDLIDVGKQMPYRVPEGFFKQFPDRMMERIRAERARRRRRWGFSLGATAVAALFAGVVFFGGMGRDTENPDTLSVSFADKMNAYISQLSDEELAEQFDYYAADVTLTLYEEE